jgi:hypothetical protein
VNGEFHCAEVVVYVTYFDEVKADPAQGQDAYWLGGICVSMDHIAGLEAQVNAISQELFNSVELTTATEFHAKCIYFGKFPFKGWKPDKRLEVLVRLVDIVAQRNVIKRVYAKMNVAKLAAPHKAAEFAFAHFCERVQMLVGKNTKTLLIGDFDAEQANATIREFSQYRIQGTPWEYGIKIDSIVDCVHFAHSHHSRMIQLADVYLFAATHRHSARKGEMAEKFTAALNARDIGPHRYKDWPL